MKLIPEWHSHDFCLIAWPCNINLYKKNIIEAKKQISNLANILSNEEKVIIFCNPQDYSEVNSYLKYNTNIKVYTLDLDDSWMRDIAPIFIKENNSLSAINFQFNGYGKYPNFKNDNLAAKKIANLLNIGINDSPITLEGGAITYDEEGNLFTTRNVIFNKNRKQKFSYKKINEKLINLFNLKKIYYFPNGLLEDDTDGHVDNIFCPIGGNNYLIATTDKNNKNYILLKKNKEFIINEFSKSNQKFNLIEIPLPDEVIFDNKKLVSSYINFYFTENSIIVPRFNVKQDVIVMDIFSNLFKNKKIIFVDTNAINYGGGNIHCVTMNVPKL